MSKHDEHGQKSWLALLVIRANNWLRNRAKTGIVPEEVLLLLPKCIQQSDCVQNISKDINNCKGCGKCPVKDIREIVEEYGVMAFVAPGGRVAIAKVLEDQVKAVVAIACEMELKAGILKSPKPVIGVINKRPNGPCFDTDVDLAEIEKAISKFIGDKTGHKPINLVCI